MLIQTDSDMKTVVRPRRCRTNEASAFVSLSHPKINPPPRIVLMLNRTPSWACFNWRFLKQAPRGHVGYPLIKFRCGSSTWTNCHTLQLVHTVRASGFIHMTWICGLMFGIAFAKLELGIQMKFDFTSDSFSPKFSGVHSIQTVVCDHHSPLSYAVAHLQHNRSCCTPLQHTMEHSAIQKATYFHAWPPGHESRQCIPSRKNIRALVSRRL